MKKIIGTIFVFVLIASPFSTHAGFFDFLSIRGKNQPAQVLSSLKNNISPAYKRGDKHVTILEAQMALTKIGFYTGDISGSFGAKTEEAVKKYQSANRLKVTGILDTTTINMLLKKSKDSKSDVLVQGGGSALLAKVFLGGPYNQTTGLMNTGLNDGGFIPDTEPYSSDFNFNFMGGDDDATIIDETVLGVTGVNAIIDWVVVELRMDNDIFDVAYSAPALLQADGDIVDIDGVSPLPIPVTGANYYVAVYHRNHLPVVTAEAVNISSPLDFSTVELFGENPSKVVNGVQVLWPGDVTFDREIMYTGFNNDRDPILAAIGGSVPTNSITGYHNTDVNMDGIVKYTGQNNDRDIILVSVGGLTPTNTLLAQLPELTSCVGVNLFDTEVNVTQASGEFGDIGTFEITFDVSALCDDIYLSTDTSLDDGNDTEGQGLSFGVQTQGSQFQYSNASVLINEDEDETVNGNWLIEEGETERITLNVGVSATQGSAMVRTYIDSLNWSYSDNSLTNFYDLNLGINSDFRTDYIFLDTN